MESVDVSKQFLKKYGRYYCPDGPPKLERLSTGLFGIDYILGGGLPVGRILEIYSNPSCGKTTLSLQIASHLLNEGHLVGYLDLEQAVYKEYAELLHTTHENFHYFKPTNGKLAIEMCLDLAAAGAKFIIIDSVPFLVPESVVESDVGHINIAPQARLLSAEQSKLVDAAAMNGTVIWLINQCRAKLGGYIVTSDSTGGNALKYMCSVRMLLQRKQDLQDKSGYKGVIKTVKNKVFSESLGVTEFDFNFGKGISPYSSLRSGLLKLELITKAGSYYSFADEIVQNCSLSTQKLGQGGANVDNWLAEHPDQYKVIYNYAMQKLLN